MLGIKNGRNVDYDKIRQLLLQNKEFDTITLVDVVDEKGENAVKFDAVVGNPPYQENIDYRGEQPPIYHYFYDIAFALSPRVSLISPARFLFDAGKTPASWNHKMLNNENLKVSLYCPNSREIFPDVEIKGGVTITYMDKTQNFGLIKNFIQNDMLRSILNKVLCKSSRFISDIIYSNTSYKYSPSFFAENNGFSGRVSGGSKRYLSSSAFDKFPEVFFTEKPASGNYAKIIGRQNNVRTSYFFKSSYLNPPKNFKKYKVFISSSNGTGTFGETLTHPFLGEPDVGATETFLSLGCFDSIVEANNLIKYISTKFLRAMLNTKKVTQGNKNKKVWTNVPLQDFTVKSDIDWTLSISEIDRQLYQKYCLSCEEINFIETNVQSMN